LSQEADFAVIGEAEDAEQVLERIREQGWDVVILDISMPGRSGLDALREIRRLRPNLPVVVLSIHSEELFAVRALRAGASGFISKSDPPGEIVRAIRKVVTGKKYVSATLAETLANVLESETRRLQHESLSDRELQVMTKIASGMTISEIATEISLSVKTISTYRARVLDKMNMRSNAELTRYALKTGLVD